jgi:very-short-patch-repair endonuclease
MNISIAYISHEIVNFLKLHFEESHVNSLLQQLSIAEFNWQSSLNPKLAAESTAKNDALLLLSKYIGYDTWQDTEIEINVLFKENFADFWKNDNNIIAQNLFNVLHLIEPRLNAISAASSYQESWEKLGNRFEQDFIHKDLSSAAGDMWIQLFEQQRSFENMPEKHQKVDYVIEFPYLLNNKKGLWIEVDGEIHETESQKTIDNLRNNYAIFNHWLPVWRIKTEDFNLIHRQIAPLQQLLQQQMVHFLQQL